MTLKEWIQTQDTRDTVELRKRATAKPVTGTTAPNLVDAYDAFEKARIANAKRVASEAGITKQMIIDAELGNIRAALKAWLNGQANDEKLISVVEAEEFFRLVIERLAESNMDADPNLQQDIGSQPIYGDSIAEQNGWGDITGDDIENALRQ